MTPAAVSFKRHYGKRNHNLVTSIVGLEILRTQGKRLVSDPKTDVLNFNDQIPAYLHDSWVVSKNQFCHSINSSMQYVLFASLNLIVDAVDSYFKELSLAPSNYVLSDDLKKELNDSGRVVKDRHDILMNFLAPIVKKEDIVDQTRLIIDSNLFHLSRELRNSWIHSDERKSIEKWLAELEPYREVISLKYKHFNPWNTCFRIQEKNPSLTLKDVASLWASGERFVEQVDALLVANKGINEFFSCLMASYFSKLVSSDIIDSTELKRLQVGRVRKFINDDRSKVIKKVKTIFEEKAGFNRQWTLENLLNYPLGFSVDSYFEWVLNASNKELEGHLMNMNN